MLLSSTTTKLLHFSRNYIVISHVYKQRNVCRTNGAPCLRLVQTQLFEQHNKQFGSDFENSPCPSLAFTHALYSLNKVFNNFVYGKLSEIT